MANTTKPAEIDFDGLEDAALVALARDEQHPMLTAIAEHSTALLTVVRSLLDDGAAGFGDPPPTPEPPTDPSGQSQPAPSTAPGRYQSIPIIVEE